ncbi:MAG TPA: hypothetical protein VKB28_03910 [Solirubrobacteraceae bacterium]|nr:hypothetical protein [Solirubrobacteraceae bacterium]
MRKLLIAGMAVAMLAIIPSAASADVPRCEASVPVSTTVTTATFTALQPKDTENQFNNVWKHDFTVIVNADGSFSGTSNTTDNGGAFAWAETVTGSFNADKTRVSFKTLPVGGGATFKVTDAAYNVSVDVDTEGTWPANDIQMMISTPDITSATTTTPGTESVKNHGQYVKALGGGKVAAQACAGMPVNSTQGVK